jgi:hypothetical protein
MAKSHQLAQMLDENERRLKMELKDETAQKLIKSIDDLSSASRDLWRILGEVCKDLRKVAMAIKSSESKKQ